MKDVARSQKPVARIAALIVLSSAACFGALNPVSWTLSSGVSKAAPGAMIPLRLTAKIDDGWHIYSVTTPPPTIPLKVSLGDAPAHVFQPAPEKKYDDALAANAEFYEKEATFVIPYEVKKDAAAGPLEIAAQVRYAVCDSKRCLPPKTKEATFILTVDATASAAPFTAPAGYIDTAAPAASAAPKPAATKAQAGGMGVFLLTAFGLGLAAIFTPCVFPMIPITVSFFLNDRGGIRQAIVFSLGIIVLFCALGFGVTAAVGPFGVVQLASNPWVNGFIALVFGAFAVSLLGAFEITLPSSLLTKLDAASRRGGYLGTLLMGLTFALTSFACVGPFVGSLLAASVQLKGLQPVLGMASFATGLAFPFFFLAAFPGYLKKLPRSGGWLARVKTVMGFALLAMMLKYASNIDQVLQLNWLTRERFLAGWFVLFAMAGLYLLGLLRLEGVEPGETLGISRLLTASAILIFAFSLLPGMFGAPLGELDAFVPAASGGAIGGRAAADAGPEWMKNQYREALDRARRENKLVLVSFTGYACTNCHWMKANMFPKPEIQAAMKDLVPVELYTDGTDAASEVNQKVQDEKFATVAIPFYAIIDPDEKVIASFDHRTTDTAEFLGFLKTRPPGTLQSSL
ncbi:MAG TPA: cytochrome c biogenesis protein CcdA [Bryobacteraceae bacterium]|nr:cytochrome c biogenesis protein CcdA [Bryobacteraceae bacterium]